MVRLVRLAYREHSCVVTRMISTSIKTRNKILFPSITIKTASIMFIINDCLCLIYCYLRDTCQCQGFSNSYEQWIAARKSSVPVVRFWKSIFQNYQFLEIFYFDSERTISVARRPQDSSPFDGEFSYLVLVLVPCFLCLVLFSHVF